MIWSDSCWDLLFQFLFIIFVWNFSLSLSLFLHYGPSLDQFWFYSQQFLLSVRFYSSSVSVRGAWGPAHSRPDQHLMASLHPSLNWGLYRLPPCFSSWSEWHAQLSMQSLLVILALPAVSMTSLLPAWYHVNLVAVAGFFYFTYLLEFRGISCHSVLLYRVCCGAFV